MHNEVTESENLAIEALKNFERRQGNTGDLPSEEDSQQAFIENRLTRKMSTVLEFLAEIYELKKE